MIELTNNTFFIFFKRNMFFKVEKSEKRERKNIVGAPPCMGKLNPLHHHEGGGEMHQKSSWNVVFDHWEAVQELLKKYGCLLHVDACNASANNFSLFLFNLYKYQNDLDPTQF